jgi:hypothetical protein
VKTYKYDRPQVLARECPFRGAFATDGWIAYHGTSSTAETTIERQGFVWNDSFYSRSDIEAVASVFRQLGWAGESLGGFAVLASFSTGDFRHLGASDRKPIFFSATSKRSLLYASRDWAGGETARALRIAFEDLDAFLNSQDFRRKTLWRDWQALWAFWQGVAASLGPDAEIPEECKPDSIDTITFDHFYRLRLHLKKLNPGWGPMFAQGTEPVNFTEQWLREKLIELEPLRERCNRPATAYAYGVIYAVRFHERDMDHLLQNNRDLISLASVSSDRIAAKALIDLDAVELAVDNGLNHDDLEEEMRVHDLDGVFTRARAKVPR